MLVAYFDETMLKDVEHALVALMLPADQIATLEHRLDEVVVKACKQHAALPDTAELHGYEMSGGKKDWAVLARCPRARVRIFKDAIRTICSIEDATLCIGCVDLAIHRPGDAHEWALTFVLECVQKVAYRKQQNIIAICDDVGNKRQIYQQMFAKWKKDKPPGLYPTQLAQFTDGLHFTPSCFSRPVQAVDLLAYTYRKKRIQPFSDPRASKANDACWEMVEPLLKKGFHRKW